MTVMKGDVLSGRAEEEIFYFKRNLSAFVC